MFSISADGNKNISRPKRALADKFQVPVLNFQRKINTAYFFHARIDQAVLLWFISLLLLRFQSKEFNRQEIGFWLCGDWIA